MSQYLDNIYHPSASPKDTLAFRSPFSPFLPHLPPPPHDLLLTKPSRLPPQHLRNLTFLHTNLVPDRHQTLSQLHVILPQQRNRHHDVVDIVENERAVGGVLGFGFREGKGVVAPVPARVEVVRGVVAVVEAVAVGLGG